jgi:hypothetical protein
MSDIKHYDGKMSNTKLIRQEKKRVFLEALVELGTVSAAVDTLGLTKSLPYYWKSKDPEFAEQFEQAQREAAVYCLEKEAHRRGVQGIDDPVFYQGQQVATVKKYSDTLLIFLLKGALPEKYKDGAQVQVNTQSNTHVNVLEVGANSSLAEQLLQSMERSGAIES